MFGLPFLFIILSLLFVFHFNFFWDILFSCVNPEFLDVCRSCELVFRKFEIFGKFLVPQHEWAIPMRGYEFKPTLVCMEQTLRCGDSIATSWNLHTVKKLSNLKNEIIFTLPFSLFPTPSVIIIRVIIQISLLFLTFSCVIFITGTYSLL